MSGFESCLLPSGLFSTFFILADHLPSSSVHKWGLLWLCALVWCFSIPLPCHTALENLTKTTLTGSSLQPSGPKGNSYSSSLACFPKKTRFLQSQALGVCLCFPITCIFKAISELVHRIWWNNKHLKNSKFFQCLSKKKRKRTHLQYSQQGKCWSLSLCLSRFWRIHTRGNWAQPKGNGASFAILPREVFLRCGLQAKLCLSIR